MPCGHENAKRGCTGECKDGATLCVLCASTFMQNAEGEPWVAISVRAKAQSITVLPFVDAKEEIKWCMKEKAKQMEAKAKQMEEAKAKQMGQLNKTLKRGAAVLERLGGDAPLPQDPAWQEQLLLDRAVKVAVQEQEKKDAAAAAAVAAAAAAAAAAEAAAKAAQDAAAKQAADAAAAREPAPPRRRAMDAGFGDGDGGFDDDECGVEDDGEGDGEEPFY